MFICKSKTDYSLYYYLVLQRKPSLYDRNYGCFVDAEGVQIASLSRFCASLFEKQTGIKLKLGEWGEFKLTPVTQTDRRREAIKRIMKERFRKVKRQRQRDEKRKQGKQTKKT